MGLLPLVDALIALGSLLHLSCQFSKNKGDWLFLLFLSVGYLQKVGGTQISVDVTDAYLQ
jgi:hypothetical protein